MEAGHVRVQSPVLGKWKCDGQVVTQNDGTQLKIPYPQTDEDLDLQLFDDGRYIDGKEGIHGNFSILDSNHVQFTVLTADRLPKGFTYINEFTVAGDRMTLTITKNPPGINRHDISYTNRQRQQ